MRRGKKNDSVVDDDVFVHSGVSHHPVSNQGFALLEVFVAARYFTQRPHCSLVQIRARVTLVADVSGSFRGGQKSPESRGKSQRKKKSGKKNNNNNIYLLGLVNCGFSGQFEAWSTIHFRE